MSDSIVQLHNRIELARTDLVHAATQARGELEWCARKGDKESAQRIAEVLALLEGAENVSARAYNLVAQFFEEDD